MCRWMAYSGDAIPLEALLFAPTHNLIDQSLSARSSRSPTNGDGFGVGWYGNRGRPGLFRSIRPAWNDQNLRDLAAQVSASLFLAHVRATSYAAVQETNCHPFRWKHWLFVHNGEIVQIQRIHRDLLFAVDEARFPDILGSTDSEIMFHLAIGFGLAEDPLGALARMAGFVEATARARGIERALWMTVGLTDGASTWAVRYASGENPPTLYHSRDVEDICHVNPELRRLVGLRARVIASEPFGRSAELWAPVPPNTAVHVAPDGALEMRPFVPAA